MHSFLFSILAVSFVLFSTQVSFAETFPSCVSNKIQSADGSTISVSIPPAIAVPGKDLTAIPTIDIELSSTKCVPQTSSVVVTMVQWSYSYDSTYVPHSFSVTLSQSETDACHYSATSSTPLDLADGELVVQEIAVNVQFSDNPNNWLVNTTPYQTSTGPNNFRYQFNNAQNPSQQCYF